MLIQRSQCTLRATSALVSQVRAFRQYPDAFVRLHDQSRLSRSLLCGSRRRMRTCKFCLIPPGLTPASRRLYEAIAAKCVLPRARKPQPERPDPTPDPDPTPTLTLTIAA